MLLMNGDSALRTVLVAAMLVLLPIGVYHRLSSQSTGEKLDRRQEGLFVLATLRPLGAAFWFGVFTWMFDPALMAWASMPVPLALRWVGTGWLIGGCVLLVWTFRSLGKNLTDTVVTREHHTLIVNGPYRWIRHPLYSSAVLLAVAICLITANWFFVVTGAGVLSVLILRTRTEERNLVARFGDSYQTYMSRTGRFVPRIAR
jgi:protein-S-isoprenylcysteine O-methyltransferase Ste14